MYIRSIFIPSINRFHALEYQCAHIEKPHFGPKRVEIDLGTHINQSSKLIQTLQNALKTHSNET